MSITVGSTVQSKTFKTGTVTEIRVQKESTLYAIDFGEGRLRFLPDSEFKLVSPIKEKPQEK